ncbi:MAG: NAD(P)H-dependent oxidoreductase [Campylobacter sp.]
MFDEKRAISDSEWAQILEAGRLAPSSLGLEPWEFELIENKNLREKLRGASWGQAQITSASKLLIIYAKISDLAPNSDYIFRMVSRRMDKNQDAHKAYMGAVNSVLEQVGLAPNLVFGWAKAQCFLSAMNMMNAAAFLGIDSCPIEGFVERDVNEILGVNPNIKRVALILPFGYRIQEQKPKIRKNLDEFYTQR